MLDRTFGQNTQHFDCLAPIGTWLRACVYAIDKMLQLAGKRHGFLHRYIDRLIGGEGPMPTILPHGVAVNGKLAVPRFHIVEHCHSLVADDGQPPLATGVEPGREQVAADTVGKTHMHMREIAEVIEQGRSLATHFHWRFAGNGKDHRKIVWSKIPESVALGVELAEPQPVRMDVAHIAKPTLRSEEP